MAIFYLLSIMAILVVCSGLLYGDLGGVASRSYNATCLELSIVILPLLPGCIGLRLARGAIDRTVYRCLGRNAYLSFAFIGTTIHEISHLILCMLFGHKIVEAKLFSPDMATGELGHISHSYNPRNVYQSVGNLFIGIAPIMLGPALIIGMLSFFDGGLDFINRSPMPFPHISPAGEGMTYWADFLRSLSHWYVQAISPLFRKGNLANAWFYIYLLITIAIAGHLSPSLADIRGSFVGLVTLFLALVSINSLVPGLVLEFRNLTTYINFVNNLLLQTLAINVSLAMLLYCVAMGLRFGTRR
ncbi:MAG: hypothetical protein ACLPN1_02475 [Dissulfurispiraceae bacterium]